MYKITAEQARCVRKLARESRGLEEIYILITERAAAGWGALLQSDVYQDAHVAFVRMAGDKHDPDRLELEAAGFEFVRYKLFNGLDRTMIVWDGDNYKGRPGPIEAAAAEMGITVTVTSVHDVVEGIIRDAYRDDYNEYMKTVGKEGK